MRRLRLGKLHAQHPGRKWLAAGAIALLAALLSTTARHVPGLSTAAVLLDDTLYDTFYRIRPVESRASGDVILVVVDDRSIHELAERGVSWPFPRDLWGRTVGFLERSGAKVIAFDILFETPSGYEKYVGDDEAFATAINDAKVPLVIATLATGDGRAGPFAPKADPAKYRLGAVNLRIGKTLRVYEPTVRSQPSLAVRTLEAAGKAVPPWATEPFRLHYYGPHQQADGKRTYTYLSAISIFAASKAKTPEQMQASGVDPNLFKDKIVLLGAISAGTYDLKSAPLSEIYPGVEVQATAIDNLLHDQRVVQAGLSTTALAAFAGALLAATLVLIPRKTLHKLVGVIVAAAVLVGSAILMFRGGTILWLPLASPLTALLAATIGAFAWSYYTEDRNRRLIVKAFGQYVSPAVVAEIEKDPARIRLTGDRHVMTVLFTDIEGFTSLSEKLEDERLTELLNYYFDEMEPLIFAEDGTLDKYIGDAIMGFWNAPLPQSDHAFRACRTALEMEQRERNIQPELVRMGADRCITRIGINTGPMVVGDMGSRSRFNYTVLGDSVNLGARLEGANKFYGSRILIAESTAVLVKDRFIVRRLDLLQVKGKKKPMPVYELMAEIGKSPDESAFLDRAQRYEASWALYRLQNWEDAEAVLQDLLSRHPTDIPAAMLLARVNELKSHPPGEGWDGVYVAKGK
ncbi:adenylate/guanylate cyclase domain-containing protein [Humisphaera borealis]|uniref:Adenylate/guanylate cyclase domain-containing protein n=1 Tax=Humisphaera borealis TaxID=2807512 RepID=A0A7M2X0D7_9BACT|nr:adenylate/guanylate cyclase domain-containing protein [Humisphaera borealis]QOV91155.1 adenylate/guanylate cyclase domain-containing protein [Humisphaera borealis]